MPDLENPQALNRYCYVYNSPLKLVDSTGNTPNHPIAPGISPFSLVLPETDSAENNALNMRLDFDAQGDPIDHSRETIDLNETDGNVINTARMTQGSAYGCREVLRFRFAPRNIRGKIALFLTIPVDTADEVAINSTISKAFGHASFYTGARLPTTLLESALGKRLLTHPEARVPTEMAINKGFRAGLGQTPIMFSVTDPMGHISESSAALRRGFHIGARVTSTLAIGGGLASIYIGKQSDSRVVSGLSYVGGGAELAGGIMYVNNAYRLKLRSMAPIASARTAASFSLLRAAKLMRFGGVTTLLTLPIELAYRDGALTKENMIPRYTLEEAMNNRARAQEYDPKKEKANPSHPYGGSTR